MSNKKQASEDSSPLEPMGREDDTVITRAFFGSVAVIVCVIALAAGSYGIYRWLSHETEEFETPELEAANVRDTDEVTVPDSRFTDITDACGISFVHQNGALGRKLLPETMGGGVAFFDYDNDGDQDLLFVNSNFWPGEQPADQPAPTMALYANDGEGRFTDVTATTGMEFSLYGMGVAIADFDNDGWRDVFLSAVGMNKLLRNEQGKFVDVTESAGVSGSEQSWSTSCGWFDYNQDGLLDLFVCNYVKWSPEIDLDLGSTLDGVNRAYGPPTSFEGTYPYLYRNDGDGKFTDVTAEAGMQVKNRNTNVPVAKSLGLNFTDVDGDGWTDVIVANDTVQNMLFHNQSGERFEEIGLLMGIGLDSQGRARGAMGIDTAYLRNNENLGIAIGNFANEMTSLYVSHEPGSPFNDEAIATGLGPESRLELTFGLFFLDYDLDGRLDLFASNGHLEEDISKVQASQQYEQSPHLFWNAGPQSMTEFVTVEPAQVGEDFGKKMVGRGAAYADIDGDGDLDVVITSVGGPARLLRNDQESGHHWLRVEVQGMSGNPDGMGAIVEVRAGDQTQRRLYYTTRSYLSQCEPVLTFGLGEVDLVDEVKVTWPDGTVETRKSVTADQMVSFAPGP